MAENINWETRFFVDRDGDTTTHAVKAIKCEYLLKQFVPPNNIHLDNLNYDKKSDRIFIKENFNLFQTKRNGVPSDNDGDDDGEKEDLINNRPRYKFHYLCHGTTHDKAKLIEKEGFFRGHQKGPSNQHIKRFFIWWHVYPYSSPDLLKEENKHFFAKEITEMKKYILNPLLTEINDEEGRKEFEKKKKEIGKYLLTSGIFKLKLFPHFECNFIYSITELLEAYKLSMDCERISFKKYGTFIYRKPWNTEEYLREIMYVVLICPENSEEYSEFPDVDDDILLWNHQPNQSGRSDVPISGEWVPYSSSAGIDRKTKRHWDHVAFAFYLKEEKHLCPKRKPTRIACPLFEEICSTVTI